MALVLADRVRESSTTTGTGTISLAGAVTGFASFAEQIGDGNTTYYTIADATSWEVGVGTYSANTLTRDTVLDSSNAGSKVNFAAGLKDVFVTLPAEKVATIDTAVTSVTATAPVTSSGGTTPNIALTTSGANSVVLRDANQNITTNCLFEGFTSQAASGTTIVLTASSVQNWQITGSGGQVIRLPNATTLPNGATFTFNNNQSSGTITVQNNSSTTVATINSGGYVTVVLLDNSIAAGSWDRHDSTPSNVSWSTNTLDYPGSITSATWNGTAVAINRGGTGASTKATAFNALSPMSAAGDTIYGGTSGAGTALAIGTAGQVLTVNSGATAPQWSTPTTGTVTSVSGTGTVNGISLSGTVTSSGNLTLGGTLDLSSPPAIGGTTASTGRFTTVTSTVATGTAPFTVVSTTAVANLSIGGNAGTVTNGVYTTDTGTVTNTMLAGSIANAKLTNSSITFGSTAQALGSTVSAISGVTIDNGAIGGSTPAAGTFTTLTAQNETLKGTGQNFVSASQAIGNGLWSNGANITISLNSVVAPDSTTTATTITNATDTTFNSGNNTRSGSITVTSNTTYTFSIYLKLGTATTCSAAFRDGSTGGLTTVTQTSAGVWTRLSGTATTGPSTNAIVLIIGGANGTFYAWGAQVELGSVVNTYIPTTTTAVYGTPTLSFSGVASIGLQSDGSLYETSAGTGNIRFYTNNIGQEQARISHTASAVNYVQVTGGATGNPATVTLSAQGSDANVNMRLTPKGTGTLLTATSATILDGTAIPAGGTAGAGYKLSSTANFGIFFGSGAPTLSAAKGSLYMRSDGSSIATRMYINTDGSTTWTNVVTAA
jgi:hypothetical protein